ncbi:MAG: pentapeptide repeat-containing protein [Prochlorothrix sp.]
MPPTAYSFVGQNLRGRSFRGHNLTGADFRHCDLRGCDFRGCNLRAVIFDYARLGIRRDRLLGGWAIGLLLATLQFQAVSLLGFGSLGALPGQVVYRYGISLKLVLGLLALLPWGLAGIRREGWGRSIAATLSGMLWGFCYGGLATGGRDPRLDGIALLLGGAIGLGLGRFSDRAMARGWLWLITAVGTYGLGFLINTQVWDAWAGRLWLAFGLGMLGTIGLVGLNLMYLYWASQDLRQGAMTRFDQAGVEASSWQGIDRSQLRRCGILIDPNTALADGWKRQSNTGAGADILPDRPTENR